MVFFNERVIFRIRESEIDRVKHIVRRYSDSFDNPSHFIRSAVIKLLQEYEEKERIEKNVYLRTRTNKK